MAFTPCASITGGLNGTSCAANPGGVTQILIQNFASIGTVGVTGASGGIGGTVSSILSATGGTASFFPVTFRRNTASFTEDLTKDTATGSLFYTQTGIIVLDKQDRVKREQLNLLDNALLVVLAQHSNGSWWMYGRQPGSNMGDGMYVTTDAATTGTVKADANGYTVTMIAEEVDRAWPVDPSIIAGMIVA